jgi:hypothetical protein
MGIMIGKKMVETYKEVGLGMPFAKLIRERQQYKEARDQADLAMGDKKKDDPQNPGLNWRIEAIMEAKGLDAVIVDGWVVTRSQSKSVTIPRESLAHAMLEAGIDTDVIDAVIEAATKTVPYTYIQVTIPKELEARAAEGGFNPLPPDKPKKKKDLRPALKESIAAAKRRKVSR